MQRQRSFGGRRPGSPSCCGMPNNQQCESGNGLLPEKLGSRVFGRSSSISSVAERVNIIVRLNGMGIAHLEEDSFDRALKCFRQALDRLDASPTSSGTASPTVFLGVAEAAAAAKPPSTTTRTRTPTIVGGSFDGTSSRAKSFSSASNCFSIKVPPAAATATSSSAVASSQNKEGEKPREFFMYQRREYDEGMNMYYVPIRMDRSALMEDATTTTSSTDNANARTILYYNMGQTYLRQDKDDEAYDCFVQALDARRARRGYHRMSIHAVPLVKMLHNIGYIQYRRGDMEEAMQIFQEALQASLTQLDKANSLNCLGVMYFHLPEPDTMQSMDCYMRALAIRKEILGPFHVDVGTSYNNLGRVHYIEGDYDAALMVYEEALAIRRGQLGGHHLDTAATIYNTGQSYHQKGDLDRALLYYEEFVRIAPEAGIPDRDVCVMLKCMAQIYHEKGNFSRALALFQKALASGRAALGTHPELASICNKMGNLYYEHDDMENALAMYEQGLEVERAVLNSLHPNIVVTLSNCAQIRKQRQEFDEALRLYQQALDIQLQSIGDSHPNVATTMSNMALCYYQKRSFTKSLDLYQEALRIRRDSLGDSHLECASALNSIGLVLFKLGLHDLAMQSFYESLKLRRQILGPHHRDVAIIFYNIATVHLEIGDDDEAIRCYAETLKIERIAGDEEDVLLTLQYISQVHQQRGHLEESLQCYQEILSIQVRTQPGDHEMISRTLHRMANIYLQSGNAAMVVRLMTEAHRRMRAVGRNGEELPLSGFHLYGFAKVHPESAAAA